MHVHSFITSALLVLAQGKFAVAAPAPPAEAALEARDDFSSYTAKSTCKNPVIRKEWFVTAFLQLTMACH